MSAGTLDTTFNSPNGYVIKQYTKGKNTFGEQVAIDSNNRTIVTGTTFDNTDRGSMFVTRYLPDGTLDTSFSGGVIFKQYITGENTTGLSVVIDSADRILITGVDYLKMFITRYLSDGTLDTSFSGGVIFFQYSAGFGGTAGEQVVIDSNNRIIVLGTHEISFIIRFLDDGTRDSSFGYYGTININYTEAFSIAIDNNNRIISVGANNDTNTYSMFITRYLSDGTPDTSFSGGVVFKQYTTGKDTFGYTVAIDRNNRIVVSGKTLDTAGTTSMFITRYLDDGSLDTTFNSPNGYVIKQYTIGKSTIGYSVVIDSNDRIIVSGETFDNNDNSSMFITRYLPDGTLDTSFSGGVIFKQYTTGKNTSGKSVNIDSDDRILVTGQTLDTDDTTSMFITRYIGNGVPTTLPPTTLPPTTLPPTTLPPTTLPPTTLPPTTEPICLPAGTPILTDQGNIPIEQIDIDVHTINNKPIVAITKTITPEKNLICFEANSIGINCPLKRTIMTPGHEVLYRGKLIQAKHFLGRLEGVYTIPYNGKDILYNVLQQQHGLMKANNMILETLHPENKVARQILKNKK